uniref:hypothetical protein n=1 Tax=Alistipes putredinis TaxID=28117 RepID=UPI003FD8CE43
QEVFSDHLFAAEFHIGKDSDKPEANANLFAFCRGEMFGVKDSESREENGNLFIVFRGASCFLQR